MLFIGSMSDVSKMYCTVTTTTSATTYVGGWAPKPLTMKERKKQAAAQLRQATFEKNVKESMERAMKKIHAEAKKNAWRPRIKCPKVEHGLQMTWWSLGKQDKEEIEAYSEGEYAKEYYAEYLAYNRGWVGLTVSEMSPYEVGLAKDFLSKLRKKDYLFNSYNFHDTDGWIGGHRGECHGFWFKSLDAHNEFVKLLKSIPPRTEMDVLGDAADIAGLELVLEGTNFWIRRGSNATALTMPKTDETKLVLAKMFVG
jgi:hypothetical protein